jgi:hypothetical protein
MLWLVEGRLGGTDMNLWKGPGYRKGSSGLITLRDTYEWSTERCMESFLAGNTDQTFGWLLRWGYGVFEPTVKPRKARGQSTRTLESCALTNYLEKIYPKNETDHPTQDYEDSRERYGERIELLKPAANLIIVGVGNIWAEEITRERSPGTIIIPGPHPHNAQCDSPKGSRAAFLAAVNKFRAITNH